MLDITDAVPMPQAKPKPQRQPRVKKVKVSDAIKNAARDYKEAYKAAYGTTPTLTFNGEWIRIEGMTGGVKLLRLKELTRQLKLRAE